MCDGDFEGGFSDPDYDDLEFRRYNPDVYGNDEVMQYYYGTGRDTRQQADGIQRTPQQIRSDQEFHEAYLRWKEKKLKEEANNEGVSPHLSNESCIIYFIEGIIVITIWIFIIKGLFTSCWG